MSKYRQGGDGDPCPQDPEHGRMYAYPQSQIQYCPHSAHKGESRYRWDGVTPVDKEPGRARA